MKTALVKKVDDEKAYKIYAEFIKIYEKESKQ